MSAACLDCEHGGQEFPCRTNGAFDAAKVAREYTTHVVRAPNTDDAIDHWSYDCVEEICNEAPTDALAFVIAVLPLLETNQEAAYFAAGPLEVLIAYSGEAVIDQIETLSRQSPRFRFVLTGVWPLGNGGTELWARVEKARKGGAHIDRDQIPPA